MSGLTRDQKGLAIEELKALLDYIQELEQKLQHGVSGKRKGRVCQWRYMLKWPNTKLNR